MEDKIIEKAQPNVSHYFKSDSQTVFDQLSKDGDSFTNINEAANLQDDIINEKVSSNNDLPSSSTQTCKSTTSDITSQSFNIVDEVVGSLSLHSPGPNFFSPSGENHIYDIWIPSKSTQEILMSLESSSNHSFQKGRDFLTSPYIAVKEPFENPLTSIHATLGFETPSSDSLDASKVTQDDNGLRQLVSSGYYYAAINLTTHLLAMYGQGDKKPGQSHHKHTAHSIQIWFTRIALLVKLRRFSMAEIECEAFGDLDSPDLYFEFYSELYGGRKGSMVPFSFRLLVAELPQYLGKHLEALNRLSKLLSTCEKIIQNLVSGYTHDGSNIQNNTDKEKSVHVWKYRFNRVLLSMTRCAVNMKDFRLTSSLLGRLLKEEEGSSSELFAALGRLSLQLGDISSAQESFQNHLKNSASETGRESVQEMINSSLVSCSQYDFISAIEVLRQALKISPANALVINNLGVCLIFGGHIREAIELVREAILANPSLLLHEALVLNLCTMYDLESSSAQYKKGEIVKLLSKYRGDGFNTAALKLQA